MWAAAGDQFKLLYHKREISLWKTLSPIISMTLKEKGIKLNDFTLY